MERKNLFTKFLTIAVIPVMLSGCYEVGSADKIGTIVKVGNGQGIFSKTIEVEMIRGGFSSGSGASGQAFHFTVEDPKVADKLRVAMDNQQEVKIKYHTELAAPFRSGSGATFLDSFELVKKHEEPSKQQSNLSGTVAGVKNPKIIELLRIQAKLLEELAAEQGHTSDTNTTDTSTAKLKIK